MRPRFANPYLLPQQYSIISRTCLYPEDGTSGKVEDHEGKLKMLQQSIGLTMLPLTQGSGSNDTPVPLSEEADNSTSEDKVRM